MKLRPRHRCIAMTATGTRCPWRNIDRFGDKRTPYCQRHARMMKGLRP